MLKIKGLKKKKKGKKSKRKEEELFEAAELEEYRKEQQRKQEELREQGLEEHEESEEWKKFKALTSGVDDILKKTQGDLNRIKSTSFFQKKPPGPSNQEEEKVAVEVVEPTEKKEKRWVGFEEGDTRLEGPEEEQLEEPTVSTEASAAAAAFPEEEEEEEESEEEDDQDDLFDTSYVDAVSSGEVKLAYIPDSPTQEESEFDPFDTSIVDKVIDPKEQKRTLVSLGCAVEVLTGKVDKPTEVPEVPHASVKRRRPRPQDLLLGSFDDSQPAEEIHVVEPAPKSILDDDPIFEEQTSETLGYPPVTPITDIVTPICNVSKSKSTPKEDEVNLKSLVEEFVSLPTPAGPEQSLKLVEDIPDELDDEFAALAAESFCKKKEVKAPPPPRPAPPAKPAGDSLSSSQVENEEGDEIEEDDPFDTSFASKVLPGKFELKLIEKEVLEDHIPIDAANIVQNKINEVLKKSELSIKVEKKSFPETFEEDDLKPLTPSQRDLLGGSTTDLSNIGHNPIQPEVAGKSGDTILYSDPFDTSVIDILVAPKKTELKYIEKELNCLVETVNAEVPLEDDDFDPRAGESKVPLNRPDSLVVGGSKRASVPKIVAFDVKDQSEPDLLAVEQEESQKIGKPLTPYYTEHKLIEEKLTSESEVDPFDTSFVSNCPGKVELKLLENELIKNDDLTRSLSDPDFNPREADVTTIVTKQEPEIVEKENKDIISEEFSLDVKLHTPVTPRKIEEDLQETEDSDPFDTSIVNKLVPGKVEIKLLEKELIESACEPLKPATEAVNVLNNLIEKAKKPSVDTDLLYEPHDEDTSKPLTPLRVDSVEEENEVDPFDTSSVANILPGKTEIKLLESELLN